MRGLGTHCWFGEMQRGLWQRNPRGKLRWGLGRYPKCIVALPRNVGVTGA